MLKSKKYSNSWLYTAMVGLGLCISATKIDRSTVLWNVARMDIGTCALVVVTLLVGLGLLVVLHRRIDLSKSLALLILLNVLQGVYFFLKMTADFLPATASTVLCTILAQIPALLFIVYASFFMETGLRKSMMAIVLGLVICGVFQCVSAGLPFELNFALSVALLPVSSVLLYLSACLRTPAIRSAEQEDLQTEEESRERTISRLEFAEYCVSLFFLNTLGMILYCAGLGYQGMGNSSVNIQVLAGAGTLLGGLSLVLVLRYLQSLEVLEILRVVLFPLLIAAIYLSSVLGDTSLSAYFVPLGLFFAALLLLIWVVPRKCGAGKDGFLYICITYLCFRLGWAMGVVGGSILPRNIDGFSAVPIIGVCFVALLLIIVKSYYRSLRGERARGEGNGTGILQSMKDDDNADSYVTFLKACDEVSNRFGLSERESEVLVYLAKGRNAKYVANKMIVSEGTARTHINHIYRKMNIRSQQTLMDFVEEAERISQ